MTTVKEFKDLDGKFVVGDKIEGLGFDADHIISFAWRPYSTLPSNPKFKYETWASPFGWRPLLDQPKNLHMTLVRMLVESLISRWFMVTISQYSRKQWLRGVSCRQLEADFFIVCWQTQKKQTGAKLNLNTQMMNACFSRVITEIKAL